MGKSSLTKNINQPTTKRWKSPMESLIFFRQNTIESWLDEMASFKNNFCRYEHAIDQERIAADNEDFIRIALQALFLNILYFDFELFLK